MFHRSVARLTNNRESDRLRREFIRHTLYDKKGNFSFSGLASILWFEFKLPILCIGAGVIFMKLYNRAVLYVTMEQNAGMRSVDAASEQQLRASGRAKGDRYIVKPRRQVDDPDMYDMPAFSGEQKRSRLLESDTFIQSPTQQTMRNSR